MQFTPLLREVDGYILNPHRTAASAGTLTSRSSTPGATSVLIGSPPLRVEMRTPLAY